MLTPRLRPDAILLALIGALLLGLALPRALGEALLLPHQATLTGLAENISLPTQDVAELSDVLGLASSLAPSARMEKLAEQIARRQFRPQSAVQALERAARLAPGAAPTWTRLALNLPPGLQAAHALRLSALTNAFDYDATPRRVDLGLRLWPYMDDGDKLAFGRLVLALWQWENGRLAMVAARRQGYDQIAPYLAHSPKDWEIFTRSYAIHRMTPQTPYLHGP